MHDKIRVARARQQFARLFDLCEQQRAELERNPAPFLEQASSEVAKHRKLMDDLRATLTGTDEMQASSRPKLETTESAILRRHRKALELLRAPSNGLETHE